MRRNGESARVLRACLSLKGGQEVRLLLRTVVVSLPTCDSRTTPHTWLKRAKSSNATKYALGSTLSGVPLSRGFTLNSPSSKSKFLLIHHYLAAALARHAIENTLICFLFKTLCSGFRSCELPLPVRGLETCLRRVGRHCAPALPACIVMSVNSRWFETVLYYLL